jgi:hypothetical protein
MQIDRSLFPVNKLDLENPTVLIHPEQVDRTKGKNVVIGDLRPEEDTKSTPSHKVVMEKLPDGEETITIIIRSFMIGSHERKVEGSNSARDNGKQKPTSADQEQAIRPPPGRLDHHGKPDWATQSHGQTTPRAGQTTSRDGWTVRRAYQTAQSQNIAPRMIKP